MLVWRKQHGDKLGILLVRDSLHPFVRLFPNSPGKKYGHMQDQQAEKITLKAWSKHLQENMVNERKDYILQGILANRAEQMIIDDSGKFLS